MFRKRPFLGFLEVACLHDDLARSNAQALMRVGYARVSTDDQAVDLQLDALRVAGCAKIFIDEGVSGLHRSRRGLDGLLSSLSPGDVLVTWKLDRLGRSLSHLLIVLETLQDKGVSFVSLTEGMDTATASGRLLFHLLGSLAEFERALIAERTLAGLRAARARGQRLGRPNKLPPDDADALRLQYSRHGKPIGELARAFGVSVQTVRRLVLPIASAETT